MLGVQLPITDESSFEHRLMMSKSGRVRAKKMHASVATYMQESESITNETHNQNNSNDMESEAKHNLTPSRKRYSDSNPNGELPTADTESHKLDSSKEEGRKMAKFQEEEGRQDNDTRRKDSFNDADENKNFSRNRSFNNSMRSFTKKSFRQSRKSSDFDDSGKPFELTLEDMLKNKSALQAFREFLKSEFSEENLDFWLDCECYKSLKGSKQMKMAFKIFTEYLSKSAEREVNIDSEIRLRTEHRLKQPDKDTFVEAQSCIYKLMKSDSFRRFITSEKFSKVSESNEGFRISLRRTSTKKKTSR